MPAFGCGGANKKKRLRKCNKDPPAELGRNWMTVDVEEFNVTIDFSIVKTYYCARIYSYSDFNLLLWFRASRKKNMYNYALYIFFDGVGVSVV